VAEPKVIPIDSPAGPTSGPTSKPIWEAARALARVDVLGSALLHACLELPLLGQHCRFLGVEREGQLVGVAAEIDGVYRERAFVLAASVPGTATALLGAARRPFRTYAAERLWSEIARAGGTPARSYLQLARLRHEPFPEPTAEVKPLEDPDEIGAEVKPLEDPDEIGTFLGPRFRAEQLALGPFLGTRDPGGQLVAAGGVEFVTDAVGKLTQIRTAEQARRQGLARAVVIRLAEALEAPGRRVVLLVRSENTAARKLYGDLGFRGTRRLARFDFA